MCDTQEKERKGKERERVLKSEEWNAENGRSPCKLRMGNRPFLSRGEMLLEGQ